MRGIVFTEFLDFVEQAFGYEMVDQILQEENLTNGGAYTRIGNYPHSELHLMMFNLSQQSAQPVSTLWNGFGQHFFGMFFKTYQHFFSQAPGTYNLFDHFEHNVHDDLAKLYPNVVMPHFETTRISPTCFELVYTSDRLPADFAEGLIEAILRHFQETDLISRENVTADGLSVRFRVENQPATL